MILNLAYYGDEILRKVALPVENFDEELLRFAENMRETVIKSRGVGLAAPQVKRSLRMFLIWPDISEEESDEEPGEPLFFVNPKLTILDPKQGTYKEGCLSIPSVYGNVKRPLKIAVEAQDLSGKSFSIELSDFSARVFLHENDHINGVLFIDRLDKKKRRLLDKKLIALEKLHKK